MTRQACLTKYVTDNYIGSDVDDFDQVSFTHGVVTLTSPAGIVASINFGAMLSRVSAPDRGQPC